MEVFTQKEVKLRKKELIKKIQEGAIFIYPTDTIYGIGCNALDEKAVDKIRMIKGRFAKPFSVIAPSLEWIKEICDEKAYREVQQHLPGPYTLVVPLKKQNVVAENVNDGSKTLGIRIPHHWFTSIIQESGVPVVTTSANKAGQPFMTDLSNLDKDIEKEVEFIIFEGEKEARPSKIINVVEGKVVER
ncbi:MAG TPA: L-threonylcarbamoyladenylate synthase [Candidatus Nanoarchaeia archaeon]|nr:L-threonylcarbamoyladenylate synthase [Candidatus Nanoarchaeia archaeon]